ncbi:hypothetical protein QF046_002344 [Microbacterium sp. W4I4]|uniref:hypothetical protein n=1 Tax=Microbacterium sp. W4I4 TaxID=3042295 RepID=UPI0027884BA4|nr:hypothetical protein [Microbacterium sp. W4I4]MDQ0614703.1 hypothetical protein [Microbacterium sp. W4I4]
MTGRRLPAWARRRRRDVLDPNILEALSAAMTAGEDEALRAVLHPDAELVIDSGGVRPEPAAAQGPDGREAAVSGLRALAASDITILTASVNGLPGLLLFRGDAVVGVVTADVRDRLLANVWVVCNPDKLRHWNR